MKTKRFTSFFHLVGFCVLVFFVSQSCSDNTNTGSQLPGIYSSANDNSTCGSYCRKSLVLLNSNVPSMIKLAERMDQGYDPSALEFLSALSFAYQVSEYEDKIKNECPETFAVYEQDRNGMLAIHGLNTLVEYFKQSN